jgi:amidohydrolase
MTDDLKDDILSMTEEMITLRREFHQYPELGMKEIRTAEKITAYLKNLGLEPKTGIAETGISAVIEGKGPGKTLMLRADMDALPIQEKTDVAYRSLNDGIMHACAHDGHMAILLAVAKYLNNHRNDFSGRIKLVFQPGEEGLAGAYFMINDGVLENPSVDAAIGLHLFTTIPMGLIGIKEGPVMSGADFYSLTIKGKSGHGAHPDTGIDAILIAGAVITSLQSIVSREIAAQSPAVVHIGKIEGGTANNIIADQVTLSGGVRTFDEQLRNHIQTRMDDILKGIITAFRGDYTFDFIRGYPVLKNETNMTRLVREMAVSVVGEENVIEPQPMMGSEDMAFFLEKVPGCFFFVGAGVEKKGISRAHHNEFFDFDEDALAIGAETMARAALAYLK